jgi:hypothetical protein
VLTTSIAGAVPAQQAFTQQAPVELLFRPYKLGTLDLPHRVVMAPLTR